VRLSDGAILWLHSGATQGGLPLAVVAGRLYVLGAGVLIVRASDGYPEGVLPFSVSGSGTPPVTGTFYGGIVSDDVLYTTFSGSPPGTTYAVRLEDGALLWHAVLDTVTNYAAVVDNGLLFTVGSELTAARSTDGALLWRYPTDPQTPHYGLLLFPVVGAGAVYLSQAGSVSFCTPSQNQPAKFIALSERDESVLWERPLSALS
jgi:outer membrane protein assembly factor BamB